jgi:nitric oxide reductase NorQ protein
VSKINFEKTQATTLKDDVAGKNVEIPTQHAEAMEFIHSSYKLKPAGLYMDELKWKYLIRSAVRGKNIMMVGPSGCGKTVAAKAVQEALGRPSFYFNMGSTQDPRSTLIGNTHFKEGEGTLFAESLFVKAIRTPNSIILLDELTRAHPDAWNILMTVLDYKQRYLRLDEKDNNETVSVANGVTFIATANIGNEYTATRVLDRALQDRFTIIEVPVLNADQELKLLQYIYPDVAKDHLEKIAAIANETRTEIKNESPRISTMISTRMSVEMAGLLYDGFKFIDAAEVALFPFFTTEGGNDSERSFIKKIVQQFNIVDDEADTPDNDEDLFSLDDIKNAFT